MVILVLLLQQLCFIVPVLYKHTQYVLHQGYILKAHLNNPPEKISQSSRHLYSSKNRKQSDSVANKSTKKNCKNVHKQS